MSRSDEWKKACADAFDALHRMNEIVEEIQEEIDELENNDKEIPESYEGILELDVPSAYEMAQFAEDFDPGERK